MGIVADHQQTLHSLLPPESTITYNLRPRADNLTLPDKHCALDSCNFVTRMLYANCYWHCDHYFNFFILFMSATAVCHLLNKRIYIYITHRTTWKWIHYAFSVRHLRCFTVSELLQQNQSDVNNFRFNTCHYTLVMPIVYMYIGNDRTRETFCDYLRCHCARRSIHVRN